ncbi:histidinol-phosphatase [Brucepastera parasyntrophica]|uniref:histidinol-phosphatase n=1 Tax=Brucepastera parasyntrophica TaxID=2880008 RepID=UPI00210A6B8F|nr:histidinol-phosphatase [Brucepastera parasyntrophica]ULQ58468.1 histidinol-phosphatase [Brucepastera parasyntrophica]
MNISNLHTHTSLCKHALGDPADYVRQANVDGCSALGFSDHCPLPDNTWPGSRMYREELPKYRELVNAAKKEADFPVFFGFECDWYPSYTNWIRDRLRYEEKADYLIYGSHWVNENGEFLFCGEISGVRFLRKYADLTVGGIQSGLFDFIAHPDIFMMAYTNIDENIRSAWQDIIEAAIGMNMPLEINGNGLNRQKIYSDTGMRAPYPVREFWEMAAASGARIICSSDAHSPSAVISYARDAVRFAEELGITPEDPVSAIGLTADKTGT